MSAPSAPPAPPAPDDALDRLRARLAGTNINAETLLATDYLNHFNEFVMLLELVAESPELHDMLRDWQPKSYIAHFAESGFSDRELAIEAYALSPARYRDPFDDTVRRLDALIADVQEKLQRLAGDAEPGRIAAAVTESAQEIRRLVDVASAVTNGVATTARQDEIDRMFAG